MFNFFLFSMNFSSPSKLGKKIIKNVFGAFNENLSSFHIFFLVLTVIWLKKF